jgi:hypothetical protein
MRVSCDLWSLNFWLNSSLLELKKFRSFACDNIILLLVSARKDASNIRSLLIRNRCTVYCYGSQQTKACLLFMG